MKFLYNLIKFTGLLAIITLILFGITLLYMKFVGGLDSRYKLLYALFTAPIIVIITINHHIMRIAALISLVWGVIKFKSLNIYINDNWQKFSPIRKNFDIVCIIGYIITLIFLLFGINP